MFFLRANLLMSCAGTPDKVLCNEPSHSQEIRPLLERVFTTSFNELNLCDNHLFSCCASLSFFLKTAFCCERIFVLRLSKLIGEALNVHLWSLSRPTLGSGGVLGMSPCGSQGSLRSLGAFLSFVT